MIRNYFYIQCSSNIRKKVSRHIFYANLKIMKTNNAVILMSFLFYIIYIYIIIIFYCFLYFVFFPYYCRTINL